MRDEKCFDFAQHEGGGGDGTRASLETEWLHLTRTLLPTAARARPDWPVRLDHCFGRILLDHAVGGRWYDHVAGRPAYRHLPDAALARAVALGRAVLAGEADLAALNAASLAWRGKRRSLPDRPHPR